MPTPPPPASAPNAPTQPASLWPHSTQAAELPSTTFALSRFDPLADEQALSDARFLASFDVCHPALALRALLLVQAVIAVGLMVAAPSWSTFGGWAAQGAFAGVVSTLGWLVVICAAKQGLRRLGSPARLAIVLSLGAAAALLGWDFGIGDGAWRGTLGGYGGMIFGFPYTPHFPIDSSQIATIGVAVEGQAGVERVLNRLLRLQLIATVGYHYMFAGSESIVVDSSGNTANTVTHGFHLLLKGGIRFNLGI